MGTVVDTRKIQLWSQDYSEVLFEQWGEWGSRPTAAETFLRNSGFDWLGLVMEWGDDWKERWSGRLELKPDGSIEAHDDASYLKHLLVWPNPFLSEGYQPHV